MRPGDRCSIKLPRSRGLKFRAERVSRSAWLRNKVRRCYKTLSSPLLRQIVAPAFSPVIPASSWQTEETYTRFLMALRLLPNRASYELIDRGIIEAWFDIRTGEDVGRCRDSTRKRQCNFTRCCTFRVYSSAVLWRDWIILIHSRARARALACIACFDQLQQLYGFSPTRMWQGFLLTALLVHFSLHFPPSLPPSLPPSYSLALPSLVLSANFLIFLSFSYLS